MEATSLSNFFSEKSLSGLRAYFGAVREGYDVEIRTPFFQGAPLSDIIMQWEKHLDPLKRELPTLYNYEIDQSLKVGPMSIRKPLRDRMDDIESYYVPLTRNATPIDQQAIDRVIKEWSCVRGIRLRSEDRTVSEMKLSTNSGSPFFTRRRRVVDSTVPCTSFVKGQTSVIQILPSGTYEACAVLGWRGQEGGPSVEDVKQRVVWMFPFAVNLNELQFYQPLIQAAQSHHLVPAWESLDAVDRRITMMMDTKAPNDVVVCTDFEKFDQHFQGPMQDAALSIFETLATEETAMKDWLNYVFPIKYQIPLMYDYGQLRYGRHGMASGSGGTNADETLVHRSLQYEAAGRDRSELNPYSQCLGDDGVLTYPGITVNSVVKTYQSHGQVMNPDKQYVSTEDCIYLRRWHSKQWSVDGVYAGVYSTMRALGRMCEMERFYEGWDARMVALRQLSILENVKNHPLGEEFIEFCIKGDKYRLGLDIPGFFDDIGAIAKEYIDEIPGAMGYARSIGKEPNISKWWVVRYLASHP